MRYQGYTIEKEYHAGTDFKVLQDGRVIDRKPTNKDIAWYVMTEIGSDSWADKLGSIKECKKEINRINQMIKDNTSKCALSTGT